VAIILPRSLFVAAIVLLCYLIGLTYTAKQEHLDRLGAVWPLSFLAVPVAYGIWLAIRQPQALVPLLLFVGWTLYALWLLRRRAKGDVPRAVVSLIAGIALLDSVILAGYGAPLLSGLAVAAFVLTLSLQRWVSGT
jgi:4-hydroxybenzoate polyprenyltransferase